MDGFDVGVESLRQDVRVWDEQSGRLDQIVRKVDGLTMDRLQAGIFQMFVGAYHDAVNEILARSTEGGSAMTSVATTLNNVANQYQQDEADNTHRFTNLH